MKEEYVEVTLSSGVVVRCTAVPPLAIPEVVAAQPECKMPPAPMVKVETKLGSEEKVAQRGSPEFEAWQTQVQDVHGRRDEMQRMAYFVLGVLSWKLVGEEKFIDKVPKSWQIPERLRRFGVKPNDSEMGRVADFIKYGLIRTGEDMGQINRVVFGTPALTEREVEAAEALFPGDEEGAAAA